MFCNVHLFEMLHVYIACNYSNSFLFCGNQFCGCCCLNRAAMAYQMIKTRLQLCLWRSTQDVRRTCKNKFIIYIFLLSFIKPQQNYRFIIIHIYEWIDKMDRRTDPPFGSDTLYGDICMSMHSIHTSYFLWSYGFRWLSI